MMTFIQGIENDVVINNRKWMNGIKRWRSSGNIGEMVGGRGVANLAGSRVSAKIYYQPSNRPTTLQPDVYTEETEEVKDKNLIVLIWGWRRCTKELALTTSYLKMAMHSENLPPAVWDRTFRLILPRSGEMFLASFASFSWSVLKAADIFYCLLCCSVYCCFCQGVEAIWPYGQWQH